MVRKLLHYYIKSYSSFSWEHLSAPLHGEAISNVNDIFLLNFISVFSVFSIVSFPNEPCVSNLDSTNGKIFHQISNWSFWIIYYGMQQA